MKTGKLGVYNFEIDNDSGHISGLQVVVKQSIHAIYKLKRVKILNGKIQLYAKYLEYF